MPSTKKPAEAKPAAKTTRPAARKRAASKTPAEQIVLQFAGGEWDVSALKEKAIAAYTADSGESGKIDKLTLYVKPEERKAYCVINETFNVSVDFD